MEGGVNSTTFTGDTGVAITTGGSTYYGLSVRSVTGATVVNIYNGTSAAGELIDVVNLTAAALQITHWLGPNGVRCTGGIFADGDANTALSVVYHS